MNKWYYISLLILIGAIVYLVSENLNLRVTNNSVSKEKEQLKNELEALKDNYAVLTTQNDSLKNKFELSRKNTEPVKAKHEKIRNDIIALPSDSLAKLFSKRFSPRPN